MTKDEQRHEIARMLLTGTWRGAKSREELCKRWGCTPGDVYRLTGEAAGAIRLSSESGWTHEVNLALCDLENLQQIALATGQHNLLLQVIRTKLAVYGALGGHVDRTPIGRPATHAQSELAQLPRGERITLLRQALADEMAASNGARH